MAAPRSASPLKRISADIAQRQGRRRAQRREDIALSVALSDGTAGNDWRRSLRLEMWPFERFILMERPITKANTKRVAHAVALASRNGWIPPVLVTEQGRVIGDPINLEAARQLGWDEVQCVVVEGTISDNEARLLTIALQHQAASAEIDIQALQFHLMELGDAGMPLELTGYELPQIELLTNDVKQIDAEMDDVPATPENPVAQLGDLWLLGEHRLLCADARDPAAYTLLMNGQLASASISDPPYNVPIAGNVSGNGKVKHQDFVMGVGEWSEEEFAAFLQSCISTSSEHVMAGGALFVFMDWRSLHLVVLAGKAAGLKHVNTCIWSKGGGAMGTPWRSAHEDIAVFAKGDALRLDNVQLGRHGRNRTNVFEYAGANRPGSSAGKALALHSTPKSVELIADAIRDVTAPGEIVLDPFMGSGTTIMAAEACGRVGYGLELDPKYVDVIIQRWQDYTGETATQVDLGKSFGEVAEARSRAQQVPVVAKGKVSWKNKPAS